MTQVDINAVVANLKKRIGELSYENAVLEAALEAREREQGAQAAQSAAPARPAAGPQQSAPPAPPAVEGR
jgi:hypothetical protein